jgi:hypothetical protein
LAASTVAGDPRLPGTGKKRGCHPQSEAVVEILREGDLNPEVESKGLASANFAMEDEPMLNREQGLFTSVLYTTLYRKEGTRAPSLNTGALAFAR